MIHSRSGFALALFIVGAGCAEPSPALTGYISVPLISTGPDGATYRLPPGTQLEMSGPDLIEFHDLDADTPSITLVVAAGDYGISLSDPAGDSGNWPLTRTRPDGTTEIVQALIDPLPAITVTDGETTSLVIRFRVPVVGPISFNTGIVDVSLEVVGYASTAIAVAIAAPSLTVGSVSLSDLAPAELGDRLPPVNHAGDSESVDIHTAGPWYALDRDTVCAQVVITVDPMGSAGFVNLAAEAPPRDNDRMCIHQGGVGQNRTVIDVGLWRQGTALTPLLSDLGDRQFSVQHVVSFWIEEDLFHGTRVELDRIAGSRMVEFDVNEVLFGSAASPDGTSEFKFWADVFETGNATLTVMPR